MWYSMAYFIMVFDGMGRIGTNKSVFHQCHFFLNCTRKNQEMMRVRSYPWKLGTNQEMTQDVYIILYLYEVHEAVEDIGLQWIDGVGVSSKIRIVFWHVNHSDDTWWRCEILWLWYDDHGWDWNSKTKTSRRDIVDILLTLSSISPIRKMIWISGQKGMW